MLRLNFTGQLPRVAHVVYTVECRISFRKRPYRFERTCAVCGTSQVLVVVSVVIFFRESVPETDGAKADTMVAVVAW